MYISMCVHTYIYIYIYTHAHTCIYSTPGACEANLSVALPLSFGKMILCNV